MSQETILVPLDGSKFAEHALPIALSLAQTMDAQVRLVSIAVDGEPVSPPSDAAKAPAETGAVVAAASEYLGELCGRIAVITDVPVQWEVVPWVPLRTTDQCVLVEYIEAKNPHIVVMSTHGRGPLSRVWMGCVADWVVHHTTVPLLLVRPTGNGDVVLGDTRRCRRILIPLDGSEQAELGLEWAKRIGKPGNALLSLVRVAPRVFPAWPSYLRNDHPEARDVAAIGRTNALEYLRGIEQQLEGEGFDAVPVVEDTESVAAGILRQAERQSADLITIATHGRNGVPRLVLGSVADKVVRGSPVPVLVVRHVKPSAP
jgi:nucleotide-binding universal stress UspA family protein